LKIRNSLVIGVKTPALISLFTKMGSRSQISNIVNMQILRQLTADPHEKENILGARHIARERKMK
jgi:hypothetical protein